jgi:hypothetical protein
VPHPSRALLLRTRATPRHGIMERWRVFYSVHWWRWMVRGVMAAPMIPRRRSAQPRIRPNDDTRVLFVGSQELEVATDGTGTCGGAFSCKLLTLLLYRLSLRMRRLAPGWVTGANA